MDAINQIPFNFNPRIGLLVSLMVGFLVFAVSLDLTWENLRNVLQRPKSPIIGLIAQFVILPAVAFLAGMYLTNVPSIALGLLLVTCCPGGALSNYLTGVARGDVATSISMTTASTLFSILLTPLLFTFWASRNPSTLEILQHISMDPRRTALTLVIMLLLPVTAGMLLRDTRPNTAGRIRGKVRLGAGVIFGVIVTLLIGSNFNSLALLAKLALVPVLVTFFVAIGLGWGLGRLAGLRAAERRAVVIEVAFQNVALAIGLGIAFFPALGGVTAVSILWGIVHLTLGSLLAFGWGLIDLD
ncbi:BASS family bile acid:Na+ symporter [Lewinella marina]|uniref:Bile acid:sodium symporter n=1 Tax=Neolewinella marina TaxID=438751 RepID=A0A2G0CB14_9BACT|nr:bile acid:sodium symporter family protein [Neolewinella marina]NJB86822.1 BASS family bile acid:Na+ symporter [Neolewinella marina]PHK97168.1 hypothetical protein CGL56_17150 [Neolewinella marina]